MERVVSATFSSHEHAGTAVADLHRLPINQDIVSVLLHGHPFHGPYLQNPATCARSWTLRGAILGALMGALLGAMMLIPLGIFGGLPGSGLLFAAVGCFVYGGFSGALSGSAAPQPAIERLARLPGGQNSLVTVVVSGNRGETAARVILMRHGAQTISVS